MLNRAPLSWYKTWLLAWVLGNALDLFTTLPLCKLMGIGVEMNPVAIFVHGQAGLKGLILFKVLYVAVMAIMLYLPFLRRPVFLGLTLLVIWIAATGNVVALIR